MATFMETVYEKAKKSPKRVVFPEGNDERTVEAAAKATLLGVAKVTMIGVYEIMR